MVGLIPGLPSDLEGLYLDDKVLQIVVRTLEVKGGENGKNPPCCGRREDSNGLGSSEAYFNCKAFEIG